MSHCSSFRPRGKGYSLRSAVRDFVLPAVLGAVSLGPAWAGPYLQNPGRPAGAADQAPADQPAQPAKDRELARRIRRAIVTDKSLSTYAHNIKIIARDGVVALKGPVRSEDERIAVNAKAVQIAGANNVRDEMTVQPKR